MLRINVFCSVLQSELVMSEFMSQSLVVAGAIRAIGLGVMLEVRSFDLAYNRQNMVRFNPFPNNKF